ncbi:MAG: glycosyltransferase, partial [Spirochaetales bacterium]|nr:glycosyltransferase [Spirochaetales bacterium]
MKVLFVVNNCYVRGNGLSTSAQRTIRGLKEAGLEVRVLSGVEPGVPETPEYPLKKIWVPIFDGLVHKQGYSFSKPDRKMFRKAVQWADVVHLEEPFMLERAVVPVVKRAGKALTATYHLHPENLYSSIHMGWSKILNHTTMRLWRRFVFNKCSIVQCPTQKVKDRLVEWNFKPELRVISNGMIPKGLNSDSPICASDSKDGTFTIITTGRYSVEKDQATLLKAMKYSKYADRIRLVIAGRGPLEKSLKRRAARLVKKGVLKHEPDFGFHSLDELEKLYHKSDLYIHCAPVEVEGLSCMEAVELGLVPIIATGKLTSTAQYAVSERSLFPARNAKAL